MTAVAYILIAITVVLAILVIWQFVKGAHVKKEVTGYQNIFKHTNDAYLLIDILDGKILYANKGSQDLLGYSEDALHSKTIFDLHEKEQLTKSSEIIARVYEEKGLIYSDMPFISAKGEKIAVECSARVEDFGGKPVIFIAARDIRERLKLEAEIRKQNKIIEEKNKDLIDSITYAQNIQHAILPSLTAMHETVGEMFVLYVPKDIVSGDFYWYTAVDTSMESQFLPAKTRVDIVAAVDCTGHGVPGAFMSLVGTTLLNQTQSLPEINTPAAVIEFIHHQLIETLNKKKDEKNETAINDGMDMSVCMLDKKNMKIIYAGANQEMYYIRNGELNVVKGDKQAIGIQGIDTFKPFTNNAVDIQKGDMLYMFSDGYEDQFGGPKGKKYRNANLKEFFLKIHKETMDKQREMLLNEFIGWKGNQEQVDDVMIIGIRI
jgi:PAS domain S-box-containing protein